MDKDLLELLRDPEDPNVKLMPASEELLKKINEAIKEGRVKDKKGSKIENTFDELLVTEDNKKAYPVKQGIPILLIEHAIELQGILD